jgi:hypothetical protein
MSLLSFKVLTRRSRRSSHGVDGSREDSPQLRRPGRSPRSRFRPAIDRMEHRLLPSTFTVTNTQDSGPGSLCTEIQSANSHPGADKIVFASGRRRARSLRAGGRCRLQHSARTEHC